MLKSILNDVELSSKTVFSIVLVPPVEATPCPPNRSFLDTRLKKIQKNTLGTDSHAQLMLSVNDTVYETSNGYVYRHTRKAKIIHSELLYTLPENPVCGTHLILYMDQPVVDCAPPENRPLMMQQQYHLSFKDMIQKKLPEFSSNDVESTIDMLVKKFCDTSILCDSLASLHDCMDEILYEGYDLIESLDAVQLANLNLDHLCGAFESYFMDLTYDAAFFQITQFLLVKDKSTTSALEDMEHLDFSQIALPASVTDPRKRVCNAIAHFERIGSFRTPAEKLDCLLQTVSELTQDSDSDSLIPLLLMTLIRSRVPHLTANLIYMRDYTFERNIKTGKYGYALSTLEGVLNYIVDAHPYLSKLSKQNADFWSCIKTGDIEQFRHYIHNADDDNDDDAAAAAAADMHDADGNNALMVACFHGQEEIAAELLLLRPHQIVRNDQDMTPLMAAIQSQSAATMRLLLLPPSHASTAVAAADQASPELDAVDCLGNTAALYACSTNDIHVLQALLQHQSRHHPQQLLDQVNRKTGDTALHVAARHGGSMNFLMLIMEHVTNPNITRKKNHKGETFYHLCGNIEYIQHDLRHNPSVVAKVLLQQADNLGRTPLMAWAAKGRLDLVETLLPYAADFSRVDNDGRTVLHLMALRLGRNLVFGKMGLACIIRKIRHVVNVRDWCHGNTALHMAAQTSTLASTHNVANAAAFIKALVEHGAAIDAVNLHDEHPVNACKIPELVACFDELHLKTVGRPSSSPSLTAKDGNYHYVWAVTRGIVQQNSKDQTSDVAYLIKSGQIDKPHTMRLVSRKIQDFLFLRNELLYEMPELFLPTFSQLCNPSKIDLHPPPLILLDVTLTRLQSFMDWLQNHPILRHHDLVMSFVRSSCDLQKSVIRDNSFSRRKLMLEKIRDMPLGTASSMMSSKDEEYFFKYAQETIMPLKEHYLNVVLTGRNLQQTGIELERNMMRVAQDIFAASSCLGASEMFACNTLAIETMRVCAYEAFEKSYVSPWLGLLQASQMAYALIDGILLSLQRPFDLINQRCALRQDIELQKEVLRKSKAWHSLFSPKEKKKRIEESKEKVVQNMNNLNHIDGQINQAHRLISDELAHYQNVHPRQMIRTLRRFARAALNMEKQKLAVLVQDLESYEQKPLPPLP
ncbi:hypothetical protein [Parasitella parasitica]|uniref:VPS9 domain-containing protein n=1 Tax=Parasitella parasitica TaxID=35722 RepID=A0A0B7NU60_9FUNG|nr:hypothetical protein [Parasitella parasitica]